MTLKQLAKRVEYWQKRLFLHEWELIIQIVDAPQGKHDATAAVDSADHYDQATIQVQTEYAFTATKGELDVTIVHELLHIKMRDFNGAIHSIRDRVSEAEEEMFHDRVEHEEEGFVQRMAEIIVLLDAQAK